MYAVVPYKGEVSSTTNETHKFSGLSNQGATCYMNSLLQSLYMTPEFRAKLYQWVYDKEKHGDKKDSIPYQLQLLFGKLQISKALYVETKGLTKSFGWDTRETFQQHDVQEFCRVLFDAIEESVLDTPDEGMINSMYEGIITDYVKCLNCQRESQREDKFLDLSLTVRSEFDKVYNDSVEKALQNYIKPETLTGDNQFSCSSCEDKQDALKGLKFKHFPYLLVLQLKRFDLDYTTLQRVKLNDKVTFSQILNINPYLKEITEPDEEDTTSEETAAAAEQKAKEPLTFKFLPSDLDSRELVSHITTSYEHILDDRDKKTAPMDGVVKERIIQEQTKKRIKQHKQKVQEYLQDGESVYELFSIMIHSGSAMGGHYYAYIKSFEDNRWYNFNDSTVTQVDEKDIQKVYGGVVKTSGWSSGYAANAYLLMYRKVVQSENISVVTDEEVPVYIKDELEALLEQDRQEAQERAEKYKIITLKVYYEKIEKNIPLKKDEVFGKLKGGAVKEFQLQGLAPEDIRVRGYSQYYDIFQDVYKEDVSLEEQDIWNYKTLAIEIKQAGSEWPLYNPNGITVRVNLWRDDIAEDPRSLEEKTSEPRKIIVDKKQSMKDMLALFQQEFGIAVDRQIVLKKTYMGISTQCELVNTPNNLNINLTFARIYEGTVFFIEEKSEEQPLSKWQQLFEKESRRYTIKFNHPDETSTQITHTEYKHSVVLDCSSTIAQLKENIGLKLNIAPEEFIMKRGGKHCQEMKDMTLRLSQANLVNTSVIYIERGNPTKPNEFRILFSLTMPVKEEDGDSACYSFIDLFDIPVDSGVQIAELKQKLADKLKEMYPTMQVDPLKMRLRERNTDRLSRVLKNDDLFKHYSLYEKKNISIQLLENPEVQLESDQMIVVVKRWWPSTWEISKPKEIVVKKFGTLEDFGGVLAEEFNIVPEHLDTAKITYSWNFARSDLKTEIYYKTKGNMSHLAQNPWYLNLDGSLFFVKDRTDELREMNEEEKKKFSRASHTYTGSSVSTWTYKPEKEKPLVIHVKNKQQQDEEGTLGKNKTSEDAKGAQETNNETAASVDQ